MRKNAFSLIISVTLLFSFWSCSNAGSPKAPSGLTVSPTSPSYDRTPAVQGIADADVSVALFSEANCAGTFLGRARANAEGVFIIASSVLSAGTYTLSVQAGESDLVACSAETVSYELTTDSPSASVGAPSATLVNLTSPAVDFNITYINADVINLTAAGVKLTAVGTATCSIGVTGGTTATPTVSLTSCSGNGSVLIQIKAGTATKTTGNQNTPSSNSTAVLVDNIPISSATLTPTGGSVNSVPASVNVTYSESADATSVSAADFSVTGTCTVLPTISVTSTIGAVTTLNVAGATCTVGQSATITANLPGIKDQAGNNGTGNPSVAYTIDNVGPTSATISPTSATVKTSPTTVTVVYNENVNPATVTAADFSVTGTCGSLPFLSVTSVAGNTATLSLFGATCAHGETVIVTADLSAVSDTMGNNGSSAVSETYTIDSVGPSLTSMTPLTSTVSTLPAVVSFTFNENVLAASALASDLSVAGTCTTLPTVSVQSVVGMTVNFSLAGGVCSTGQTVIVTLNGNQITDTPTNAGSGSQTATYTFDNLGPAAISIAPVTGTVNAVPASITVTFDENVSAASVAAGDLVVTGTCAVPPSPSVTSVTNNVIVFSLAGGTCNNGQVATVTLSGAGITDATNNSGSGNVSSSFTIDSVGPTPSSLSPSTGRVTTMPASLVAEFDTNVAAASAGAADLVIAGSCAGLPTASVASVSGRFVTFNLTAATCAENATLNLTISGADVTDDLGNAGSNSQSVTYTKDTTGPAVFSFSPVTSTVTTIPFSVTILFSENITTATFTTADIAISGTCGGLPTVSVTSVVGNSAVISLGGGSCSHSQTAIVTINRAGITDLAGNSGAGTSAVNYTVDNVGPTILNFTPAGGVAPPASVDVTLSESVLAGSVDAGDFLISGSCGTLPMGSIGAVSGNTITFNLAGAVCVSTETVEITLDASLVTDAVGNAGSGSSQVIYTEP